MIAETPGSLPLPRGISIIIPCWRDDALVRSHAWAWAEISGVEDVAIVTASPSGELAGEGKIRVLNADAPNRGRQMNLGARDARGEVLIFHHADSVLTPKHVAAVLRAMENTEMVGGAFHRQFDERHPAFRWIGHFERWRNQHFGSLFGDQSLFVRRAHFQKMGGYRDYPLMEDMEFSGRLRKSGRIVLLDPPMRSSARRHEARGAWKTSLQNALFILLYHLGVSPITLHRWYYSL